MGCSICLDTYEESNEQDRGRRPVALMCGHIFHRECSDSWLKRCKLNGDPATCPICKQLQGSSRALQLWPGDVRDMDTYLANRNRRVAHQQNAQEGRPAPATIALDRYLSREKQGQLLGNLMDFQQHINAYVMAINNVSMSTRGGDSRIYRLFADVRTTDEEKQALFERSMEGLSRAAKMFEETTASIDELRQETERLNRQAKRDNNDIENMKRVWGKHMETRDKENREMSNERTRVKRLELHYKLELQSLDQQREELEKERKRAIAEVRQKEQEAQKFHLDSMLIVAQKTGDAKNQIEEHKAYVMEQERLRIAAEDKTREVQQKNSVLADRFKILSEKLDQSRREVKRLKAQKEKPSVKREDRSMSKEVSPISTMAPHVASQLEDDGFVEVSCNVVRPPVIKRSRLSYEQDDNSLVVLDDDHDDFDDYPMPGFLHQHNGTSSSSSRPAVIDGDSSVEITEIRSTPQSGGFLASNEDYLQRAISGPLRSLGARVRRR